jgi:hypothetical protein
MKVCVTQRACKFQLKLPRKSWWSGDGSLHVFFAQLCHNLQQEQTPEKHWNQKISLQKPR